MDGQSKEQSEGGFYCEVCDCIVKDSLNYFDHVNGKRHLRNVGVSVKKFADSTLEEVKEMLEFKKRERDGGFDVDEEEGGLAKTRNKKKNKQKVNKRQLGDNDDMDDDEDENEAADEDDMARLMGFSSFSTTKR